MVKNLSMLFARGHSFGKRRDLKQVGLDRRSLDEASQGFSEFCEQKKLYDRESGYGNRTVNQMDVDLYARNPALIKAITNGTFEGIRIVEVGPGTLGIACLAYLSLQGASVFGVDVNSHAESVAKELGVSFAVGGWEQIDEIINDQDGNPVDIIYTTNMSPRPYEASGLGHDKFALETARAMDEALLPGGVFFANMSGCSDYLYRTRLLVKRGFKGADFQPRDHGWRVRIGQKPF